MMKNAFVLLFVLALASCANQEKKPAVEATPAPTTVAPSLNSVETIDAMLTAFQEAMGDYKVAETAVTRGDAGTTTVKTYSKEGAAPTMVSAMMGEGGMTGTQEYYLSDGKVVMLRELIMGGPSNTENRFYFSDGNLMKALGRNVPGRMAWDGVAFEDYKSPDASLDFRLKYSEVQRSADEYLNAK
jgi:hypothetical protein